MTAPLTPNESDSARLLITFGAHKGQALSDRTVPDSYVEWLARRGSYANPNNRFETQWKVPIVLSIEARREMERRGYKRINDRYYKEAL